MIIDVHTHIGRLPNSPFAKTTFEQNLKSLLKEMKAGGVETSLVLPWFEDTDSDPSVETALKLTKGMKNIKVVGTIDVLNYKKEHLEKLEDWLKSKKIIGVKLYPGYQYFYPNQDICSPIYKLCEKYGVPVIFHAGDTLIYQGHAKVKYSHPLPIDDVATNFPNLKIVIAHLGNPWLIDCAELLYKNKNVYADISGLVVSEGLNTPYGQLMKKRIQELIIYSSSRKLLYGTDWPLADMKSYIRFTKSLGLAPQDLDYVFYKNAKELFGL